MICTCKSYRYLNLDMVNVIVAVRGVPNNVNYKSNLGGEKMEIRWVSCSEPLVLKFTLLYLWYISWVTLSLCLGLFFDICVERNICSFEGKLVYNVKRKHISEVQAVSGSYILYFWKPLSVPFQMMYRLHHWHTFYFVNDMPFLIVLYKQNLQEDPTPVFLECYWYFKYYHMNISLLQFERHISDVLMI